MTFDKVIEVACAYRQHMADCENYSDESPNPRRQHVIHMVSEMEKWGPERIEKAMRWLGFMQGVLWCEGYYTIEEMKQHNMPDTEKTDEDQ